MNEGVGRWEMLKGALNDYLMWFFLAVYDSLMFAFLLRFLLFSSRDASEQPTQLSLPR